MYEQIIPGKTPGWKRGRCACGKLISRKADQCRDCFDAKRHNALPEREEFIRVAKELKCNFSALGRHYGVSDNGIRKRCRAYGLPTSPADLAAAIK